MTAPNGSLAASVGRSISWQGAAWAFYDTVGELRFGASWIGNAMSRVNLVAASAPLSPGDEPTPIDPGLPEVSAVQRRAAEIVATIAGGASSQGQILSSFGVHLTIAGIAWLVIEPDPEDPLADAFSSWNVYSSEEVRASRDGGGIEVQVTEQAWRILPPEAVVVRCWRRHPRRSWEPDSPTHGVLAVLREINLLQEHVLASAQSRLAGAGILAIPSEAVFPPGQGPQASMSVDPDDENITAPEDTFVETLVEAMTVPISDRASAAAVVPLVVRIPGEFVDKIKHISFATPFDDRVLSLLDSAIKRLALGLDLPPEVLTGTSGMNHWGAWQVEEQAISLHIEPLSELVTHAFTVGYLRPALISEGFSPADAESIMCWYDTSDLTSRPDKTAAAREAYDRIELSGAALLREMGLSIDDMPSDEEKRERILLSLAKGSPALAPALLEELGYLSAAQIEPAPAAPLAAPPAPLEQPASAPEAESMPAPPESAAEPPADLLASSYLLAHRALERAGSRLRSAAGRRTPGGSASISCEDPARLHCEIDASSIAEPEQLLDGAWRLCASLASEHQVDALEWAAILDAHARDLIVCGEELDRGRLASALVALSCPS